MYQDKNDFIIQDGELDAALKNLKIQSSSWGIRSLENVSYVKDLANFKKSYQLLDKDVQDLFQSNLEVLTKPAKKVKYHYNTSDVGVTRSLLCWSSDPLQKDEVVVLTKTGTSHRIGNWSANSGKTLAHTILAPDTKAGKSHLYLELSPMAIITWLAILEHHKKKHLFSLLKHEAMDNLFNLEAIEERLQESKVNDFRWPLLFVEKVLPYNLFQFLTGPNLLSTLEELIKAELIERIEETEVFELTAAGEAFATDLLHEVSKLALCRTENRDDGTAGHECCLFIRSATQLYLFNFAGETGVVGTLDATSLNTFLNEFFQAPRHFKPIADIARLKKTCPSCQAQVSETAKFCEHCGTNLR